MKIVSELPQVCGKISLVTVVTSTNKTSSDNIAEILLKVALSAINPNSIYIHVFERNVDVDHFYHYSNIQLSTTTTCLE